MIRLHLLGPVELAGGDDAQLRQLLAQPKRLALLAYLACRPAGEFVRRDVLLGVFWPDLPQDAARRSLRQALHLLRTTLGPSAIASRGDDDVAVDAAYLAADAPQFLAAAAERRHVEALDLYRGDLLAGFFLSGGSVAFEHWLEEERGRLRGLAAKAAEMLAETAERAGDAASAAGWARRALGLTPDDEVALRRLLGLLDRAGDRGGALRAYDSFARRLARELDEQPSQETRALVAGLRGRARPSPALDIERPATSVAAPESPVASRPGRRALAGVAITSAVLGAAALLWFGARPPGGVLAVGAVVAADSTVPVLATRALPELLATGLGRVRGLQVIDHPRFEQVTGQLLAAGQPGEPTDAARAAGATELVEGTLYRLLGDSLRLDLRRIDARQGIVLDAVSVTGRDVFALADSAAARFAARLREPAPTPGLASVTSPSLVAHGLYDEGLRTFYRDGDYHAAARLFQAALDQDSTFAMAAYFLGRSMEIVDPASGGDQFARAVRLASHATEREALLIRVQWPAAQNEPGWRALADSLAARSPGAPEGRYAQGLGGLMAGDYPRATAALRDVIHIDSLSLPGASGLCMACDAYAALVLGEIAEDSIPLALRDASTWLRISPRAPRAWDLLADALERSDRLREAFAARDTAARLRTGSGAGLVDRAYFLIRGGDFTGADRLLAAGEQVGSTAERTDVLWWHVISLRAQGRPLAAVPFARRMLALQPHDSDLVLAAVPIGAAYFEAGDFAAAARIFDASGIHTLTFRREHPGLAARHRAWALAQRATVAAATGDTARLRVLADSITVHARGSAFGRDWTLPAYAHGLYLERTGRLAEAADSFRATIYSPTEGYTRINLELARTLIALGRPREAIGWMQAALRGGMEASNYFLTRTDAHEMLAQAFAAAGQVDSARAHYAWVVRAWSHAEPPAWARREAAARYLAQHPAVGGS